MMTALQLQRSGVPGDLNKDHSNYQILERFHDNEWVVSNVVVHDKSKTAIIGKISEK